MRTLSRLQPGFKELADSKTMLAFVRSSPLTLDYCRDILNIESPLRVVHILNNLGKQVGFNIQYSKTQNLLTYINTKHSGRFSKFTSALRSYHAGTRCIFRRIVVSIAKYHRGKWLRQVGKIQESFAGSDAPGASQIVCGCLAIREGLEDGKAH